MDPGLAGAGRGVGLTLPAWQTQVAAAPGSAIPAPAPEVPAVEITPEQGALVPLGTAGPVSVGSSSSDSDSEEDEELFPPGPLDAERSTVSGPGFSGGAAGNPVSFFITAKDGKGMLQRGLYDVTLCRTFLETAVLFLEFFLSVFCGTCSFIRCYYLYAHRQAHQRGWGLYVRERQASGKCCWRRDHRGCSS